MLVNISDAMLGTESIYLEVGVEITQRKMKVDCLGRSFPTRPWSDAYEGRWKSNIASRYNYGQPRVLYN
jgi:hypothetical protein